jgi:hypothetical protein
MRIMAERVNATIVAATTPAEHHETTLENALGKTIHVTRWDAQRELLDTVQGHIKMIREERDRIKEQQRLFNQSEFEEWRQEIHG